MGKNLRLRDARREKGLTQQALAEAVGVTRQTIHAVESGEYNPTIRLCRGKLWYSQSLTSTFPLLK